MVSNDVTLFFTYCPQHALHAAQITSKWKCRIFFRFCFDKQIRIECITGSEETVCLATRITSQSLWPCWHLLAFLCSFEVNYTRVTPRQRSSFQINDWLVWQLRVAFEFSFTWKWVYWNQVQVQGRKVTYASKQATLGDSGATLQNTVDDVDIEEHLMSLVVVNIKYSVQTKEQHINWLFWLNHLCNFEF